MKKLHRIQLLFIIASLASLFAACLDGREDNNVLAPYLQRGDSISKAANDTLRSTLMKAMAEKGLSGAVGFCNERALPITQLYAAQDVTIQRVAEKYRNPINKPDSLDTAQWQRYQSLKTRGDSLTSFAIETNNAVVYYKPIFLQPLCASCHGRPEAIPPALLATIDSLYPGDLAKGFSPGDLRGMWKITFLKQ